MNITEKQKRFADYYIETGNGTEAARKAGYKGNDLRVIASQNLTKLNIKSYIDEKMKEKDNKRIASQDEILEYFTKVMRGESESEVVVIEGQGDGFSEARRMKKKPDEKERLSAAKELAKRYGLDKPVGNIDKNIDITIDDGENDED